MARTRRTSKRKRRDLTLAQHIELVIGPNPLERPGTRAVEIDGETFYSVFESEPARREAAAMLDAREKAGIAK